MEGVQKVVFLHLFIPTTLPVPIWCDEKNNNSAYLHTISPLNDCFWRLSSLKVQTKAIHLPLC